MVHWPGDPPVKIKSTRLIVKGDTANVSKIDMGSHTGTHMDAPYHFVRGGLGIDRMPLDATVGKTRVIEIRDPVSVKPEELKPFVPRIRDSILSFLRNVSYEEVIDSKGLEKVRHENSFGKAFLPYFFVLSHNHCFLRMC